MFLLAIIVIYWQMPRVVKFQYEFQLFKPWQHESLYAPFDFPVYKDAEMLKVENEEVLKSVKPIFQFDDIATQESRDQLEAAFDDQTSMTGASAELNKSTLLELFDQIEDRGVVAYDKALDDLSPDSPVRIVRNKTATTVTYGSLFTLTTAREAVEQWESESHPGVNKKLISSLLYNALRQNVEYDAVMTRKERDKALSKVSLTYGMVQKDELIISEGEIVDDHAFAVLSSLQREYATGSFSRNESIWLEVSQFFLVALLLIMILLYLRALHHNDVYLELNKINLILLLMVIMIIPSYWITKLHPSFIMLMPVVMLTMIMVTFFSAGLAFTIQVVTVLLISMAVPNPFQYIFMHLVASMVVIFILSKHKMRRH